MYPVKDASDQNNTNISTKESRADLQIPLIYQSLAANTQNILDRLCKEEPNSDSFQTRQNSINNGVLEKLDEAMTHAYAETYKVMKNESPPITSNSECECNVNLKRQSVFRTSDRVVPLKKPIEVLKEAKLMEEQITPEKIAKKVEIIFDDHLIQIDEFLKRHDTSLEHGLDSIKVEERRLRDGKNVLPPKKRELFMVTYMKELFGGFNVVMWIATILCFLCWKPLGEPNPDIYNLILSTLLCGAVFLQSTFSFIQQYRSDNLMANFEKLMPHKTTVLRNGRWETKDTWELVVGDVVRLTAGDKVPADMRIIECSQASVETSSLTGESEPIKLSILSVNNSPYETKNIVLFGSMLVEGTLTGVVFHVGSHTVMAKIANLTQTTKKNLSTMEREINLFAIIIGTLSIGTGVITYILWYSVVRTHHPTFLTYSGILIACISVIVSFFPEGLQIAVTMTLTLVAKEMKKINVLVKKMSIIETLGSTTVIASDKTGTITMNKMSLINVFTNGYEDLNFVTNISSTISNSYLLIMKLVSLCNKAMLENSKDNSNEQMFIGSPTECGILKCIAPYIPFEDLRLNNKMVHEISFNSKYKYHVTVHRFDKDSFSFSNFIGIENLMKDKTHLIIMKGAPEVVSDYCSYGLTGPSDNDENTIGEFTEDLKSKYCLKSRDFASKGERVLGLAFGFLEFDEANSEKLDESTLQRDLCFSGLLSLIDPPRPGVADAVNNCHEGGIKVMMVTGDHHLTATAIASKVNIIRSEQIKYFKDVKALVDSNPKFDPKKQQIACHCKNISSIEWLKRKILPKKPLIIAKKYQVQGAVVIEGKDIPLMELEHWDYVLSHGEIVFARTTPQNKLEIVKQLQRRGEIVTVTGDGVNDAPALKKADIGIAMGIAGTEISKEAAQVIIMDDNFSTIVNGIRHGRLLFDNIKKVIAYLLPAGCFSEILPVLAYVFFGLPLPLTTLQMIAICLGTDIIGSISMVYEYQESDLMKRKPRNAAIDHLISYGSVLKIYFQTGLLESVIAFFMYFYTMHESGVDINQLVFAYDRWNEDIIFAGVGLNVRNEALLAAQTAYFVSLVMCQIINLFTVRTRFQSIFTQKFRPGLIGVAFGEVLVVLLLCYIRPLHPYLQTHDAYWYHFLFPLLMGIFILIVEEFKKFLIRKFPNTFIDNLAL